MVGALRRVMICPPKAAGWMDAEQTSRWRELSYYREPDFTTAEAQHAELRRELEAAGAEVLLLRARRGPIAGRGVRPRCFSHHRLRCARYAHGQAGAAWRARSSQPSSMNRKEFRCWGKSAPREQRNRETSFGWMPTRYSLGIATAQNDAGVDQLRAFFEPHGSGCLRGTASSRSRSVGLSPSHVSHQHRRRANGPR